MLEIRGSRWHVAMSVVVVSASLAAERLLNKENAQLLQNDCGTVERRANCLPLDAAVTDQLGLEVNARPGAFTDISVRRDWPERKSEIVIAHIAQLRILNTLVQVPGVRASIRSLRVSSHVRTSGIRTLG